MTVLYILIVAKKREPALAEPKAGIMEYAGLESPYSYRETLLLKKANPAFANAKAGLVERTGLEPPDSYRETPLL